MRVTPVLVAVLAWGAVPAWAHEWSGAASGRLPPILGALLLALAWGLYEAGLRRVPAPPARTACFRTALATAALASFGPLDAWAAQSTAVHMVQHMLFMVIVAPLAALGHPLAQWGAAIGRAPRPLMAGIAAAGRHPLSLGLVHGAIIWVWHVPALYLLALSDPWWHLVEHAAFIVSGWLFWGAVLLAGRRQLAKGLLAVVLTLMHTGLLGALLTFGRSSFYGPGRGLEDQQLAGLIMWVPGGLAYLAGAAWVAWRLLSPPATALARGD